MTQFLRILMWYATSKQGVATSSQPHDSWILISIKVHLLIGQKCS